MTALIKHPSVHSGRFERLLGKETCERLSGQMRPWYGRPIPVAVPRGDVVVDRGGDFRGRVRGGAEVGVREIWEGIKARSARALRVAGDPSRLNAGFSSLSDFVATFSTPSKRRKFPFSKVGAAGTTAATSSLWQSAGWPGAGAAGSAAPGGRAPDDTTVGAWPLRNAAGGETMKFVAAYINCSGANATLLLYDRIYDVAKTMSSAAAEAVNGSPTRYQSTTATDDDYAGDNFVFPECQAALGATAHNWTPCTYTNQAGTGGQTLPSVTGISSCAAQRLDMPINTWFCPLAAGDVGIQKLTNIQCSAVVTGSLNFVIGHPIAWIPCSATASVMAFTDGATTAFERILDDACLAFLEPTRPTSTAFSYSGMMYAGCS